MRLLVACILLLATATIPLPAAEAQGTWSVDASVSIRTATSADYLWKITGLTNTNLTLPIPDNATFLEAFDDDRVQLSSGTVGENVWVVSKTKPFTLRFRLDGQRDGRFSIFPAQVAAGTDSPVTVGLSSGDGWQVVGWRNNLATATRDADGKFHHTGPAYVQWLVLDTAEGTDPGPAPLALGRAVLREGEATIRRDEVRWVLETTYDTDIYGRSWEVHLPDGATVVGATTPVGPAATQLDGDVLRVTTPYPPNYRLGPRPFTVEMLLPAPESFGGAFLQSNLSIRAGDGDHVSINVLLADGLRYSGARVAGGREVEPMRYAASGPLSLGVALLPPAASGNVQFEEGMFVVDAPAALATAARATARNATDLLPRAADFAYTPGARPFYVSYTAAPIFGWEQGFYSNGLNTISIRASTLENATDGAPHVIPVGVLVHEATHGLVDRMMPDAPADLSFLHEGLARLAESAIEPFFPEEQVMECTSGGLLSADRCTIHSARPTAKDIQEYHQASRDFPLGWTADAVPDSERGFLYDYSGLVLTTFDRRAPPGALENAVLTIARTTFTDDVAADSQILLDILLANAPGATSQAIVYPGREARQLSAGEFHACMGDLVAPPYPWDEDDVRTPPGGCPANGYGPRVAELPTPPPAPEEEPIPPPSPAVVTRPPSAATQPPGATPTEALPPGSTTPGGESPVDDGSDDDVPGAVAQPPGAGPPPGAIPAPSAALAFALVAIAAALLTRRR